MKWRFIEVEVTVVCPHCRRRIDEPAGERAAGTEGLADGADQSRIAGADR